MTQKGIMPVLMAQLTAHAADLLPLGSDDSEEGHAPAAPATQLSGADPETGRVNLDGTAVESFRLARRSDPMGALRAWIHERRLLHVKGPLRPAHLGRRHPRPPAGAGAAR